MLAGDGATVRPTRQAPREQNLEQGFLTLLEVLNPASFISAFTEPFVIGKIKYIF